jgi:hypothetical protein
MVNTFLETIFSFIFNHFQHTISTLHFFVSEYFTNKRHADFKYLSPEHPLLFHRNFQIAGFSHAIPLVYYIAQHRQSLDHALSQINSVHSLWDWGIPILGEIWSPLWWKSCLSKHKIKISQTFFRDPPNVKILIKLNCTNISVYTLLWIQIRNSETFPNAVLSKSSFHLKRFPPKIKSTQHVRPFKSRHSRTLLIVWSYV